MEIPLWGKSPGILSWHYFVPWWAFTSIAVKSQSTKLASLCIKSGTYLHDSQIIGYEVGICLYWDGHSHADIAWEVQVADTMCSTVNPE